MLTAINVQDLIQKTSNARGKRTPRNTEHTIANGAKMEFSIYFINYVNLIKLFTIELKLYKFLLEVDLTKITCIIDHLVW